MTTAPQGHWAPLTKLGFTSEEADLLQWLSQAEFSQYGECYGDELDSLVAKGLAQIHGPETETENNFIAKGRGMMFRAVSLTDAGHATLAKASE